MQMTRKFLVVFLLAATAAAVAQTGSKVLIAVAKATVVEVKSPGSLTCEGGQPTNDPQGPPCSPGTKRIFIWNRMSVLEILEAAGPAAAMYRGKVNVVCHCNVDEKMYGHCWGTYEIDIPELGGRWEGSWAGPHDLATGTTSFSAVGYGYGGKLEGLEIREQAAFPGGTAPGTVIVRVTTK
jgi:hypothetical protein